MYVLPCSEMMILVNNYKLAVHNNNKIKQLKDSSENISLTIEIHSHSSVTVLIYFVTRQFFSTQHEFNYRSTNLFYIIFSRKCDRAQCIVFTVFM